MKALIIGGGGFVGRYLAEHLVQDCGWETFLTKLPKENVEVEGCEAYNLDILDKDAVEALLVRLKPDAILHLAAQSSVAYSWKNPQLTADINIHGCLNVLDAVRSVPGYAPKILLIGSGEEYGVLPENTSLVSETTPVHPANPYAITKLARSSNNSDGSTLYVTASPCIECAKLIIQAGIKRVVYAEKYRLNDGIELMERAGIKVVYLNPDDASQEEAEPRT